MDTKDESEPVEYRLGYARGVAAGRAEADRWWAERYNKLSFFIAAGINDCCDGEEEAAMVALQIEMAIRAEEVLGE